GVQHNRAGSSKVTRRLKAFLASSKAPPPLPPLLSYSKSPAQLRFDAVFGSEMNQRRSRVEWQDCPVSMRLNTIPDPVVALNVFYQPGPHADSETEARLLIVT